jgi:hypothetical protein
MLVLAAVFRWFLQVRGKRENIILVSTRFRVKYSYYSEFFLFCSRLLLSIKPIANPHGRPHVSHKYSNPNSILPAFGHQPCKFLRSDLSGPKKN